MCGINLLLSPRLDCESRVARMNASIRHRGPDDAGIWTHTDGTLSMGHRRLSIIDLSKHGHQPMFYDNGNLVLIFNGEIYNYQDVRRELVKKGYRFQSNSDSEVLLAAYQEWGESCVHKLNGMWAFALLDQRARSIFCSRDRCGMKPFYYCHAAGDLYVSSEIKSILAAGVKAEVNPDGLNEYFTFQNIISGQTLFKGIFMLKPGHNMRINMDTMSVTMEQYWDMEYAPVSREEKDLTEELNFTFKEAVKRHLNSDVKIGATISGGMDSSAIVAVVSTYFQELNTFTGYFDTKSIDSLDRSVSEKDDARLMANHFRTTHHEREISPQDVIDTLPSIVWHLEDPKVGMCYTFFAIAQLVSQHVTINLSGTGGDEIFAGYPWRYSLIENVSNGSEFDRIYYNWWCRLIADADKPAFFTDKVHRQMNPTHTRDVYSEIMKPASDFSNINKALYFDMKTFLHGFLLVEDKMGMAYSIETRFPYLDAELLDFMKRVPDHMKYRDGVAKRILKQAFSSLLPEEIIHKRKQGFTPPDRTWYKRELSGYIRNMLLSPKSCIGEYIRPERIAGILDQHANGSDERLLIWSMLFFEGWLRTFLRGDEIPSFCLF